MGRKKVNMERITEEKKRNTTYRNRKNGIIKKAKELSVLCDVDTAIIIYPPGSNHPEIWPQDPDHIKNMIRSYKEEKNENRKRTYGLNDYFQDRKRKVEEELVRARERNLEAKYPTWFDDLNSLSEGQLRQLATELEKKKNNAKAVLERKKRELNVQIKNNQPSTTHSMGSLNQVEPFNQDDDDLLISQGLDHFDDMLPDFQMPLGFELENNQQSNHSVGSYPSLVQGGFCSMMSHDDAPTTSSINPLKPERSGFGYPAFGCDVVYDHNSNRCPRQTLEQCGQMPEGQPRQFAIGLENKKNTVKGHLERKKRNLNVQIENNQPSSNPSSYPSLDQVEPFNHDDDLLMSQWFDDIMPDLQMPFENKQPSNPSYPSLDQVQSLNPDLLMSQAIGRFNDMPDLQKQLGFELGNKQQVNNSVSSYPSVDQGGFGSMMRHDFGWFNDAPTTWSIPERSGFGYPVFGCDGVYDNSKQCPCQTLEQCSQMPEEFALQDSHDGLNF